MEELCNNSYELTALEIRAHHISKAGYYTYFSYELTALEIRAHHIFKAGYYTYFLYNK